MADVITRFKVETNDFDRKIKNAQRSLDQFGLKGSEAGRRLSGLTNMFTSGVSKIGPWGAALGAAAGSMKVLGDAFKHNEVFADRWQGTMDGAKSAYNSFLTALNTGDFGGFFSNMRSVINAARDAYDSLDNLGTYNAFAARGNAKNKAAYANAVANYREKKSEENKAAVEAASKAIIEDLEQQKTLTAQAYTDAVKKLALEQGLKGSALTEFQDMFKNKSWAELTAAKAGYAKGKGLNMATYWNGYEVQGNNLLTRDSSGVVTERRAMTDAEQAAFRFAQALNQVTDEAIKSTQSLGAQEYALDEAIGNQRRAAAKITAAGDTSTGTPKAGATKEDPMAGSIAAQEAEVRRLREEFNGASVDMQGVFYNALVKAEQKLRDMKEIAAQMGQALKAEPVEAVTTLEAEIGKMNTSLAQVKANMQSAGGTSTKTATDTGSAWSAAASAVSSVSGAISSLEDPAAKIAGIVGQAIATVTLAFASSLKGAVGPWDYIAAAAAGLATTISTISAIKSVTSGYAEGGLILPNGSPYQGDNIVARLNAGEGVLTAQGIENAGRLASQTTLAGGNLQLTTTLKGEDIAISLENNNRRRGRSATIRR